MSEYRRNRVPGGTYFFTIVTLSRRPFLTTPIARRALRKSFRRTIRRFPFTLNALVVLPDHLHAIWTLPPGETNYPTRWGQIKEHFTRTYLDSGGSEGRTTLNRIAHRERAVWQHRFWEHTVENEHEFKRCLDYIHYNPVRHGLVSRVSDYRWSSFRRYVKLGEYELDWGTGRAATDIPGAEWE
jgi:putative transposase